MSIDPTIGTTIWNFLNNSFNNLSSFIKTISAGLGIDPLVAGILFLAFFIFLLKQKAISVISIVLLAVVVYFVFLV